MKNIFCFVFLLTLVLVLGRQDVQKKMLASSTVNTATALKLLEEVGLPTFQMWTTLGRGQIGIPLFSEGCLKDMEAKKIGNAETGIRYNFQTTCYLIGNKNFVLSVRSKNENFPPGGKQCASNPAFQAVILPFYYDANTYMILDPAAAPWFFTYPLSGCDIFVATSPYQPNKHRPIVIHSNLNTYKDATLEMNLQLKGKSADKLLAKHQGYELIARVYYKPLPKEEEAVNNYLKEYKKDHQKIMLLSYTLDPPATGQVFHFFGHYDMQKKRWNFLLKGEEDGVTTLFAVSEEGDVVSVGGKTLK